MSTPRPTLQEIGLKHGTDNATFHEYYPRLEPYFAPLRDKYIDILEIGVAGGAGTRTLEEYFPSAAVVGVDINPACVEHGSPHLTIYTGDASKKEFWTDFDEGARAKEYLDIILDDGAHTTFAIHEAFGFGFQRLRKGGLFVITDLHAVYLPEYNRDNYLLNRSPAWTAMNMLFEQVDRMNCYGNNHQCGKPGPNEPFEFIHFYKSMCVIKKA